MSLRFGTELIVIIHLGALLSFHYFHQWRISYLFFAPNSLLFRRKKLLFLFRLCSSARLRRPVYFTVSLVNVGIGLFFFFFSNSRLTKSIEIIILRFFLSSSKNKRFPCNKNLFPLHPCVLDSKINNIRSVFWYLSQFTVRIIVDFIIFIIVASKCVPIDPNATHNINLH